MRQRIKTFVPVLIVVSMLGLFFGLHFLAWQGWAIRAAQAALVLLAGRLLAAWLRASQVEMVEDSAGYVETLQAMERSWPVAAEDEALRLPLGATSAQQYTSS